MPSTSTLQIDKAKQQVKEEEEDHEVEREFELIHIDSDEENETIILTFLLQNKNAQKEDLEVELESAKYAIHFYQIKTKKMSAQQAIYEARAIKARREAQRAQTKLEERMGVEIIYKIHVYIQILLI